MFGQTTSNQLISTALIGTASNTLSTRTLNWLRQQAFVLNLPQSALPQISGQQGPRGIGISPIRGQTFYGIVSTIGAQMVGLMAVFQKDKLDIESEINGVINGYPAGTIIGGITLPVAVGGLGGISGIDPNGEWSWIAQLTQNQAFGVTVDGSGNVHLPGLPRQVTLNGTTYTVNLAGNPDGTATPSILLANGTAPSPLPF